MHAHAHAQAQAQAQAKFIPPTRNHCRVWQQDQRLLGMLQTLTTLCVNFFSWTCVFLVNTRVQHTSVEQPHALMCMYALKDSCFQQWYVLWTMYYLLWIMLSATTCAFSDGCLKRLCCKVRVCIYVCMHLCMYVRVYEFMYVCMHLCMYVHVCICMYIYIYIYIYAHVTVRICTKHM